MNKSEKEIKKIIKDLKEKRFEGQQRVYSFIDSLAESLKQQDVLLEQLRIVQSNIRDKSHLIEMYKVLDGHHIFDIWKLELAIGITKKKYPEWIREFEDTKDGFKFKTNKS